MICLYIVHNVKSVCSPVFRPHIPDGTCSEGWLGLIYKCWDEQPDMRPSFNDVLVTINQIHRYKNLDLVDNMIKRLERYTFTLEERVEQRSREIQSEKNKADMLVRELLPPSVAESLALGHKVEPEAFDNSTIFFSDIVGFTRISSEATPMQIVIMLNDMYTLFDDIAHVFDVYKVATIGDAYMVTSGVPIRNGDRHAREICNLAVALLDGISDFPIPHLPGEHLCMRIGVHSGPCVAAVVGTKMPRYLLFGETVDIAAKMESGGEPMRIHISETTQVLVTHLHNMQTKERGKMQIKGKGDITTYWLTKKN